MSKSSYLDESLSFEERARLLVSEMTLEEKISQMMHGASAIERLDVPDYNWWCEALHGVARAGVATVFPQSIGMAAAFDPELLHKVADVISTEGRAKYHEFQRQGDHGIYKGLTFWSPTINIDRDPRWGRGQESYGEDPYLTSVLAVSYIKGLQGDDARYLKAAACMKHFAVHSGPEADRHHFDAKVSQKDLWETYLPAFKASVKEANVAGAMGAYNRTNGEPCCGSKTLLQDILRGEWKFDGYVTSDCWAIRDFNEGHNVTKCEMESAVLAVQNGCHLNCGCAYAHLLRACTEGLIDKKDIDDAVYHLMLIRMRLGLFDEDAHVPYASIPYEVVDCEEHRALALDVAKKSMVLLKNSENFLPLDKKKLRNVAVIGPNADSLEALLGNYCGTAGEHFTMLAGIREALAGGTRVYYAEGCHLYKDRVSNLASADDRIAEAVAAAQRADVAVLCVGLDPMIEGEEGDASNEYASGDKPVLGLPSRQQALLEAVAKTGTPMIVVLMAGSALTVNWADEHAKAIVQAWYPGAQGGRALASLLFGDYSPSGRMPVTVVKSEDDLPDFTDYSMENRTYRYMKAEPLYPFGFGLSYTRFDYSCLSLSAQSVAAGADIRVCVTVKNIGSRAGDEIVQLYLQDVEASVPVPHWSLAGTQRVTLEPGCSKAVEFAVTARQMALINLDGRCILEPGDFTVYVGGSQPDRRSMALTGGSVLSETFTVIGTPLELER